MKRFLIIFAIFALAGCVQPTIDTPKTETPVVTTPETPDVPDTPATPATTETPETPATPETPPRSMRRAGVS